MNNIETINYKSNYKYTVISAVYNVGKYLDTYFKSLTTQSLSFKSKIKIYLIDDGSTDNSADVIKTWQNRYPDNITYIKKEHSGVVSTRNSCLKYLGGDWVTFIDPDDFIDRHCFKNIDRFIFNNRDEQLGLLACNHIIFNEEVNMYVKHPLGYRFEKGDRVISARDPGDFIQLNVSSAFFNYHVLKKSGLQFDERIEPNSSDLNFIARLLLQNPDLKIGVVSSAKYYYRKRADKSSTIDTKRFHPGYYDQVLEFSLLAPLHLALKQYGHVPFWLQHTVFNELAWRFKEMVNDSWYEGYLSGRAKSKFLFLVQSLMQHIAQEVVDYYKLPVISDVHKVGILALYKGYRGIYNGVKVVEWDRKRKLIKLSYCYAGKQPMEAFYLGEEIVEPKYSKHIAYKFLNQVFAMERIIWFSYEGLKRQDEISAVIDREQVEVKVNNITAKRISLQTIMSELKPKAVSLKEMPLKVILLRFCARIFLFKLYFKNAWLFMDRDTQADDNAEHLYRFVQKKHPEIKAFFILRKTSHDWQRLKKAGFRLIRFGSIIHRLALLNARHLISSHADHYVVNFLNRRLYADILNYDLTFLQHGVTKHDLSNWLNKKQIDLFITCAVDEYNSFVEDYNTYKFCAKEVVLTGFPRHDRLLDSSDIISEKIILIMPTWRPRLFSTEAKLADNQSSNPRITDSEVILNWKALLHDTKLKELAKAYGYKMIFFPHAKLRPCIGLFAIPDYIEIREHSPDYSIQDLFKRASCLVTDYSSVVFEMAYLYKPVLYYQFDNELIYKGEHLYQKGYFDYSRDGFGPVCKDSPELMEKLSDLLKQECRPEELYLERMQKVFAFRDGKCSERVYEAVKALDNNA